MMFSFFVFFFFFSTICGEVFFHEQFKNDWEKRWIQSKHKDDYGKFSSTHGKYSSSDFPGIKTSDNARFYALSSKLPKVITNKDKKLVVQFHVTHEQSIDCGGAYVKIFPSSVELEKMHSESPYNIMFGPDICGSGTKKVHVILGKHGKNYPLKKDIECKNDELTHVYTLVIMADNTLKVFIDNELVESASLENDFDILQPKEIEDPNDKKPDDWVDLEFIDDVSDKKPEDWDKPQFIPDPKATKPEDWNTEMDGDWEPPKIENPEFKGEWKPKQIKNPDYKGIWTARKIKNPEYKEDPNLYHFSDIGSIGLDLWQVKAGTIFRDVLITDDEEFARKQAESVWGAMKDDEKLKKDEVDKEEMKKAEKEAKLKEDKEEEDDEEEDADPAEEDEEETRDEL